MKRYILFSNPTELVMVDIIPLLFPKEIENKVLAYMPAEGYIEGEKYDAFTNFWKELANKNNSEFLYIDNSKSGATEEIEKLKRANILLITGGNVCKLLKNIRSNKLDQAIIKFSKKDNFVIAGFSAGAMILTPGVELGAIVPFKENEEVGLTDFTGLNILDFEVFPHYDKSYENIYNAYKEKRPYPMRIIGENEYISIEK